MSKMMMMVVKLEENEEKAVDDMANMWKDDPDNEEISGWSNPAINRMLKNLPYVEPDHQPMIEDMILDFDFDEEILSDRVLDTLNDCFG